MTYYVAIGQVAHPSQRRGGKESVGGPSNGLPTDHLRGHMGGFGWANGADLGGQRGGFGWRLGRFLSGVALGVDWVAIGAVLGGCWVDY